MNIPAHHTKNYGRLYEYVAAKCTTPEDALIALLTHLDIIENTPFRQFVKPFPRESWPAFLWRDRRRLARLLRHAPSAGTQGIHVRYDQHWAADDFRAQRKRRRDYLVGGMVYRMPELAFTGVLLHYVTSVFRTHIRPGDRVVEFGCGAGRNLFTLRRLFPALRLQGFDISPSGVAACRHTAERLGITDLEVGVLDLTDAAAFSAATATIEPGAVLMTMGCLECVPDTPAVVSRLLGLRPRLVIHCEPLYELHKGGALSRDFFTRRHLARVGYMKTLVTSVGALQREGRARIVACERTGLGKALLEYSLLVWAPAIAAEPPAH